MTKRRRPGGVAFAVTLAVGAAALAGVVVVRARAGGESSVRAAPSRTTAPAPAGSRGVAPSGSASPRGSASPKVSASPSVPDGGRIDPRAILVWVPGHLPPGMEAAAGRLPGVDRVAQVVTGTAWMTDSTSPSGRALDRPPGPYAIPIEVAAADPSAYAAFFPQASTSSFTTIRRLGRCLVGESEERLRHQAAGGTLAFGSRTVKIGGIVPDGLIGSHELLVSTATAAGLGLTTPRYLLVLPSASAPAGGVEAALRRLAPAGTPILVAPVGREPFVRDSPKTLPAVLTKLAMGEFSGLALPGGAIQVDPAWVARHIVTASVPILGPVTCNRAFVQQLREALAQIERAGLAGLIHPSEYAGCFVSRFVTRDPTQLISHHSWGAAVDLNASENAFGAPPHQDPRVVSIFESLGFQWGGEWVVPDGMHFEFRVFPPVR